MPPRFGTRIKKLLDIDRAGDLEGSSPEAALFAFADAGTEGSGSEAAFSAFDVFCLALGLDLLDVGFKQTEIIFLLRHVREDIRDVFDEIVATYPPASRQKRLARDHPKLPAMQTESGELVVDTGVYLLLRKIELSELVPVPAAARIKGPIITPPVVARGQAELGAALADALAKQRAMLVLEIARSAGLISDYLDKAPALTRGRKSES